MIDFKASEPKEEYVELYRRQLHAYALEYTGPEALALQPRLLRGSRCSMGVRLKVGCWRRWTHLAILHSEEPEGS